MRALACVLLLAGAAAGGDAWTFAFENGDRVRARLAAMRDGVVLLEIPAARRAVPVPFGEIVVAEPADAPARDRAPAQVLRLRDGGALLGTSRAIREGRVEFEVESLGLVRIPGGDVAELLAAEDALRAYRSSLAARPSLAAEPLAAARIHALWARLGRQDGTIAWQAHRELVRAGPEAVARLDARLQAQPDGPDAIAALIRSLESDSAETRSLAYVRLCALREAAKPHLKAAARQRPSAEARRRIAALLAEDPEPPREPDPEVLRFLRAIRVLEEIGTPEALAVLDRLAGAAPGTATAREATEALERLRRRG